MSLIIKMFSSLQKTLLIGIFFFLNHSLTFVIYLQHDVTDRKVVVTVTAAAAAAAAAREHGTRQQRTRQTWYHER